MKLNSPFQHRIQAFSLVEVVLALGLISFALIAMVGLFSISLKTGKESAERTQAANLASTLLSTWRATTYSTSFPLPPLTNLTSVLSNTVPITVGIQGTTTTNGLPNSDIYKLRYRLAPGSTSRLINVYLLLWWPANAAAPSPGAYYEITTEIAIP